jgi:hypothetical protein
VAILTAIAIPGFRKATEDFRLNEFACNFDSLIKAFRSYYLIFNEWPADVVNNIVPAGNIRCFCTTEINLYISLSEKVVLGLIITIGLETLTQ